MEEFQEKKDDNSNNSVLEFSLDSAKNIDNDSSSLTDNSFDIILSLSKKVDLPIEQEKEDEDLKEEPIEQENILERYDYEYFELFSPKPRIRSKTMNTSRFLLQKTPKPKPIISNEYISPFKLCMKSFGDSHLGENKRFNNIFNDFQKNIPDNKSCNDKESLSGSFMYENDTERTTPNEEDLNDLSECRKKMKIIMGDIEKKKSNEYENILTSKYVLNDNENNNELINNYDEEKRKKARFWLKHIKQQRLLSNKANNSSSYIRNNSLSFIPKRNETMINKGISSNQNNNGHSGLFILGILESAVNEKKGRKTVNI